MGDVQDYSKYTAEFVGTFLLVFTVGCNVIAGSATWAVTSIAAVLMVSIYALGGISGGNFNPAVSIAIGLSKQIGGRDGMEWKTVAIYCAVQIGAGIAAGLCYSALLWQVVNVAPKPGFGWMQAMLAEILYTFMLCFVVLNTAFSKKNADNQYFGLAIGFVVVAGGYGAGAISGGAFNPAVAIGLDVSSAGVGLGWGFAYAAFEVVGAVLAVALFRVVRPDEFDTAFQGDYELTTKCVSEFIGTFMLVLTVGLNVLGGSPAAAWSIAASLMCMIFALASVSSAHFNPAVTLAIVLSGRQKCEIKEGGAYVCSQILGGITAAFTCAAMHHGRTFPLGPVAPYNWVAALAGEFVFTFVLSYVVLCVATTKTPLDQYFGLAIGFCVTAGGLAIGGISGGSLNPAVSVGISSARILHSAAGFYHCLIYSFVELLGGVAAAGVFHVTHATEYTKDASLLPILGSKSAGI